MNPDFKLLREVEAECRMQYMKIMVLRDTMFAIDNITPEWLDAMLTRVFWKRLHEDYPDKRDLFVNDPRVRMHYNPEEDIIELHVGTLVSIVYVSNRPYIPRVRGGLLTVFLDTVATPLFTTRDDVVESSTQLPRNNNEQSALAFIGGCTLANQQGSSNFVTVLAKDYRLGLPKPTWLFPSKVNK